MVLLAIALGAGLVGAWLGWSAMRYPADTTPEGAYLRIASALGRGAAVECFAYLDEEAQQSSYTIVHYARRATELVRSTYPEPERTKTLERYAELARCPDGPAAWVLVAERRGWLDRLRRDLSVAEHVERAGERATVVTARGTRYPFRRRPNGIWGLTMFTAELSSEAERLARDWDGVQRAARDYQQAR